MRKSFVDSGRSYIFSDWRLVDYHGLLAMTTLPIRGVVKAA